MKINFFKKNKIFQKISLHFNFSFYWQLAISIMLLIVLGTFVFSYYLFIQINKEVTISTDASAGQVKIVTPERIDQVLDYFFQRGQKTNQILYSPSPVVDPSL